VPTPYRFDFTQLGVSGLKNENTRVQSVTNFLKIKNGQSKPGPYNGKMDHARGVT